MIHKLLIVALISAALISLTCTAAEMSPASASLGRLFFSPNQRAELDRVRHAPPVSPSKAAVQIAAKPVIPASLPSSELVTVNGLVQRSDGQSTVWINSRPISDQDDSAAAVKHRDAAGRVTIQVPNSQRVQLKVGQSADLKTGEISERYANSVVAESSKPRTKSTATAERSTKQSSVNETDIARSKHADRSRSDPDADVAQ